MSNDTNIFERVFKLWAKIAMLIVEGKRDPHKIADVLQKILETSDLLRFLATVNLLAITGWNAKKAFTTGKWYLGSDFENNFVIDKDVDVPTVALRTQELIRGSRDEGIRVELGAELEEIQLGQFHSFLMTQADHSKWYVAYIKDKNGKLWAVDAFWHDGGWSVFATSVGHPSDWGAGRVIVSRDPGTLGQ